MLDIIEHAQMQDWYAATALGIMLLLQLSKRKPALNLLAKVPKGWRWIVPLVMGCASVFVGSFVEGLALAEALRATLVHGLGVGFVAMGGDAAMAESPMPWSGGKAGIPRQRKKQERIIVTSLAVLCALVLTGCVKGVTPAQHADRETCYAKARLNFHEATESCKTEACIDDLADDYQREQEACK